MKTKQLNGLANALKRVFLSERGRLRVGWMLMLGIAAYYATLAAVLAILGAGFGALFSAWGLTQQTLPLAPRWAQWIVGAHTDLSYGVAYLLAAAVLLGLKRGYDRVSLAFRASRGIAWSALIGLALGAALTLLALALDSMRLESRTANLHAGWIGALLVIACGKVSAEILARAFVMELAKNRWGRAMGYVASCLASLLLSFRLGQSGGLYYVNAVLMGLVCGALYERAANAVWAPAAFQTGFAFWLMCIFAFPGMSGPVAPVYTLYHVSDAWLTGGNAGPLSGAFVLLMLAGLSAYLFRSEIKQAVRRMRAKSV